MGGLQSSVINPDLGVKSWMGCNLQSSVQELELVKSRGAVVLHGSIMRVKASEGNTNPNFDAEGWNEARLRRQSSKSFLTADVLTRESSRRKCDNVRHASGQECSRAHPHVVPTVPILALGRPNLRLQAAHASPNVCPFRQRFFDKLPATVDELGATFHLHKIWLGPMPLPILFHPLFLMHSRIMNNARELHLVRFGGVSGKSQSGWPAISCPKGPNHVL